MNQLGILSHVWNVFSFPYNKTIRWTDEESWHLESSLKFATRRPYNAIRSKYEESWHVESFFEICPPWTQPSKIYIYIHSGPYKTLHSTSFSMNKPSRAMFNMPLPYLCIRWIYEQSRNDTSSLYFELLSFPWKTIPRTNQTMGFLSQFRNLQFRDPTMQYLEHVIIVGILSHCCDFFPFPLPCTNCYVQHMTQLGILSHFWNLPPRPFNMLTKWSKLTCRVGVIKIFCASDVTKQ